MEDPFVLALLTSTIGASQCLRIAAIVSERLGQELRIAHIEIGPRSIVLPSQEELSEYEAEHLADREVAETEKLHDLVMGWSRTTGISAPFDCFEGDEWRAMRQYRGKASTVVLATPHTQPVGHREALRAALLRSGHPVVMVPPDWEGSLGQRLMVGWEDVQPLRRALAAFAPFLSAAAEVRVVAVDQDEGSLVAARATIAPIAPSATYHTLAADGRRTATVLLDEAGAVGADGLVMGAFRRGEILNWLKPGTSSWLIRDAFLPLLMCS